MRDRKIGLGFSEKHIPPEVVPPRHHQERFDMDQPEKTFTSGGILDPNSKSEVNL